MQPIREISERAMELLQGAVDLHVHPGPSPFPRRLTVREAALRAAELGFRAIVVKSHHHSTVSDVLVAASCPAGLPVAVLGGVALNNQIGGLNPYAVELALKLGGRVVWFPTISAAKHIRVHTRFKFPRSAVQLRPAEPVQVIGSDGRLVAEAYEVLTLIRDHDAVLATGHLDAPEVDILIREAVALGVRRILVNHPNFVVEAEPTLCRRWAELGAYIEHSLCMYDDRSSFYHWPLNMLVKYIRAVGPERTVLGSDLGQADNPLPTESYLRIVAGLLDLGIPAATVQRLVAQNPVALLGLE
ncbi:MAG: hypothetical protein C4315_12680 [Chloroflexota bacterium]